MTFEEYAYARGPALIRLARLLTGDRHLAEDLVQDVLARAYARWRRIGRTEQPDHYVRRMLVNAHHSWWRRRSSHEIAVPVFPDRPDRPGRADEATAVAERDAMWRHVAALPARQRTVIVLRYYEDLDDAAIAELMGCSAGTVRTHAKRALTTLRAAHTPTPAGTLGPAPSPSPASSGSSPSPASHPSPASSTGSALGPASALDPATARDPATATITSSAATASAPTRWEPSDVA